MNERLKMVLTMFAVACAVGIIVFVFLQDLRWAFAIAGGTLLMDLIFVPKILPNIFNQKNKNE